MKKKSLLLAAASVTLVCSMSTSIVAQAGINTNAPFGNGLIENGQLNEGKFMLLDDDTSAYAVKPGNGTLLFNGVEWRGVLMSHNNPIPAADLTDGTKVVLEYDMYAFGAMWEQCFYASPLSATLGGWGDNYMTMRINRDCVQGYSAPAGSEVWIDGVKAYDNTSALIGTNAGTNTGEFGLHANAYFGQIANGNDHCTYRMEYDITEKSLTLYAGDTTEGMTQYATVKNAFTLAAGATNYYMNFGYDNSYEIDNVKVYSVNGETVKTYLDCGFDSTGDYMIGGSGAEEDRHKLVLVDNGGKSSLKTYDTVIRVNNPSENARYTTLNPLKVDDSLDVTFEMSVGYSLTKMVATRKIGVAFGLNKYNASLAAPEEGASFLYLTVNGDNAVVLGAENIAEDGTVTAVGTEAVLPGVAVGSKVSMTIKGRKDGSVDVQIGENVYNFPSMKLSGNVSFTQRGTGDVDYSILVDGVNVTGYEFKENEGGAYTASFDNNYISTAKFAMQSKTAPSEYMKKQETSAHEPTGITVDGGKVGFYGTSTNTRLMFKEKYADFVLQFDYISEPVSTRYLPGGIETGGAANRYSPLFILFGADNEIPELTAAYAYGIIEGNPTQYFWGAESIIAKEGKAGSGLQAVLSGITPCEYSEDAIPCYGAKEGGGYGVTGYGMPNNSIYSFYNKTSRVKFVVINNNVAMYAAEVNADGTTGDYVLLFQTKIENSYGNVGFGTDAPGWAAIDNVAITPIAKEVAIAAGVNANPAVDLVADVPVSEMVADEEPKPLAKAVVSVDADAKKATWEAVEGAKEYEVSVKLGTEEKIKKTVTATEIDLSELTEEGEYKIVVTSVPEDEDNFLKSRSAEVVYTVSAAQESSSSATESEPASAAKSGCTGAVGTSGVLALLLGAGVVFAAKKRND